MPVLIEAGVNISRKKKKDIRFWSEKALMIDPDWIKLLKEAMFRYLAVP